MNSILTFEIGLLLGLLGSFFFLLNRCFFKIEEGHVAVVQNFGKLDRNSANPRDLKIWTPGVHFKLPWQKAHIISLMERTIDLSGESGGRVVMTEDGTLLRIDSKLRLKPLQDGLYDFLAGLKNPIEHIQGVFTCLLRNEIANFPGSYAGIRRNRKLLNERIQEFCQSKIGSSYGVRFDAVDLTDVLPPEELEEALNAVFAAEMEAKTHYSRAEAETQQRVLSAQKGVSIAQSHAKAEETEILVLGTYLKDLLAKDLLAQYVEHREAETLCTSKTVFVRN